MTSYNLTNDEWGVKPGQFDCDLYKIRLPYSLLIEIKELIAIPHFEKSQAYGIICASLIKLKPVGLKYW